MGLIVYQTLIKLQTFGFCIEKLSNLNEDEIYQLICSVNCAKVKSKYIKNNCQILKEVYNSDPPENIDSIIKLPGVGQTYADLYLNFISESEGHIAVTKHVQKIAERLRWVNTSNSTMNKEKLMEFYQNRFGKQ